MKQFVADSDFTPKALKDRIDFEALAAVDARMGLITAVAEIENSDRLVELTVDFGSFTGTSVAGMKGERHDLQEVVGLQALFVVNLAPRKMAGVTSTVLLFDVGSPDGIKPALAVPERRVPNGTQAG